MDANQQFKENLGMFIRQKRHEMGLTKEQVSKHTGIDNKHLGKIERGIKLPNSFTLVKIAVALGLDLNKFVYEFGKKYFDDDIFFKY